MKKSKAFGGLGFKDLDCFNKTLLAKQLWRILEQPHSILGRTFKAKNYPSRSLIAASLGVRPYFAWRNLYPVVALLKEATISRVGNGNQVKVWKDKSLHGSASPYVLSPKACIR